MDNDIATVQQFETLINYHLNIIVLVLVGVYISTKSWHFATCIIRLLKISDYKNIQCTHVAIFSYSKFPDY